MQGSIKQPVNAEEILEELKRVLESSTPPPSFRSPSVSGVSKSGSTTRPQIVGGSDRRIEAAPESSAKSRRLTERQKALTPTTRSWKRAALGVALAGAALICAPFALVNKAPNPLKREPSIVATEPQSGGETLQPASDANRPMQDSRPAEPLSSSALEALPDTNTVPATTSSLPVAWGAAADVPQLASLGLESAVPAFTPAPPNRAATPTPQVASLSGTATASALSGPASTDRNETPKPTTHAAASATVSAESARPSTPKIDSTREPLGRSSPQKPAKIAKTSARPVVQSQRHSPQLATPSKAESPSKAAQDAGNPTPAVAPATPTIAQRFADGMTHGFSYLAHLPGTLLPHPADPNSSANP
jgi:hypothetical protein